MCTRGLCCFISITIRFFPSISAPHLDVIHPSHSVFASPIPGECFDNKDSLITQPPQLALSTTQPP